jgi:DNA segregation ATPase FtsK/SpoIIIE, S-DNA-T family
MSIERLAAGSLLALLDRDDPGRPERLGGVRTPIGWDADGAPVILDLLDPGLGGDGEHGLLIGTAAAGRAELLQAIVLGLAAKHAPRNLHMALIDGTGGGTFNPVLAPPHVAGAATGVAADRELAGRVVAGITEELDRRLTAVTAGPPDRPLTRYPGGTLLIVIDGGATLIRARPEFGDLVVTIGRIGRCVGVHLLLSCERLDSEALLSRVDVMLPVRLALRTSSEAESRAIVGSPDAAHLPVDEHHGLLRTTDDPPVWFRCAGLTTAQIDVLTRLSATAGPQVHSLWS